MEQTKDFIWKYREEQLKEEMLPEKLKGRFELLACIHVSETHASFLLRSMETGEKYLLKRGNAGQLGNLNVEKEQQMRMEETGMAMQTRFGKAGEQGCFDGSKRQFSSGIEYWVEGDREYLLRRYIEGQNLEEYLERNPVLETGEILGIAMQVCDILIRLHHLKPPMIHRDIKPQNLILDRYGTVHLIDFETSRNFDRKKRRDTRFYGTEETAAPEQYGYAQTDARTDIYAFGKVLCYLLTGDYQVEECRQRGGRLSAIVERCCAFDPKKRYQTMEEVKRMLLMEQRRSAPERKKKRLRMFRGAAVLAFVFLAGILIGNYRGQSLQSAVQKEVQKQIQQQYAGLNAEEAETGKSRSSQERTGTEGIQAEGDLLSQAAAASLNKEKITEEDLKNVVRVAVIGTTVYDMTKHFEVDSMIHEDEGYINNWGQGTIADISLLAKMPNLSEVYLYNQNIMDIGALEGLPIRKLYLSGNLIGDFRVVEKLPQLKELFISNNPIRYLPDFSKCSKLKVLVMNENTFANLDCLKGSAVEQVAIRRMNVVSGDYTFLEEMPGLTKLAVWNPEAELTEEISNLASLREFEVFDYHNTSLDFLETMQNLELLTINTPYEPELDSLKYLKKLSNLSISSSIGLKDISVVANLSNLQHLAIDETGVTELSVLAKCRNLREVWVNEEQAAYIEEHDMGHEYQVYVR